MSIPSGQVTSEPPNETSSSSEPTEADLAAQLEQKVKEIKLLSAKNIKLEQSYMNLFRNQKLYQKDHSSFVQLLRTHLPSFSEHPLGQYDVEQLSNSYKSTLRDQVESLESKIVLLESELSKEKQQNKSMLEKAKADQEVERKKMQARATKSVEKKLQALQNQVKDLLHDQERLQQQLQAASDREVSLQTDFSQSQKEKIKMQHQINRLKSESIAKELEEHTDFSVRPSSQITVDHNEYLALRGQVEALMIKRDELRKLLESKDKACSELEATLKQKNSIIAELQSKPKSMIDSFDSLQDLHNLKKLMSETPPDGSKMFEVAKEVEAQLRRNDPIITIKPPQNDPKPAFSPPDNQLTNKTQVKSESTEDSVHREYFKNVFLKYWNHLGQGDEVQATALLQVMGTMLRLTPDQIEGLTMRRKSWWGIY